MYTYRLLDASVRWCFFSNDDWFMLHIAETYLSRIHRH